ncbi:hypothetical protein ACSBR1_029417 [Camellia fascicularis]
MYFHTESQLVDIVRDMSERFRGSVISERFRSSIATTICTAISILLRSSDLNSDPSITRISSTSGGSTIAKPICSICYEDLNPIIEDLQSISICRHVFCELCLQQCIEYCSNAKKKRCLVCKQAFSEANELDRSTLECVRLQERNMALAKELAALKLGEARALHKLGKAKEKIKKLKARIQGLKTAVEVKDNEVLRALKASKKTILEGDILNDVDWNSNSSSISEDLAVEKNCFSSSEAASDTRSEVHRPCNKDGVSGSRSAFWTNEDWEGSRSVVPAADLVVLPYQSLLSKSSRESLGLNLKNNIVITDEAHNLVDSLVSMYDSKITLSQIADRKSSSKIRCNRGQRGKSNFLHLIEAYFQVMMAIETRQGCKLIFAGHVYTFS